MIKAILFDADNTIYNTSQVAKLGDMAAMSFFSSQTRKSSIRKSSTELYDDWKIIVGRVKHSRDPKRRSRKYSYSILAGKYNLSGVDKAYTLCMSKVLEHLRLTPSFKSSLVRLEELKFGIITDDSAAQVIQKLRKFRILDKFEVIITSDQTETMKPSRLFYELALKKLKIKPEECAVVGDSFERDLSLPKKQGCLAILFEKGGIDEKKDADYTIHNFGQLVGIIKKTIS